MAIDEQKYPAASYTINFLSTMLGQQKKEALGILESNKDLYESFKSTSVDKRKLCSFYCTFSVLSFISLLVAHWKVLHVLQPLNFTWILVKQKNALVFPLPLVFNFPTMASTCSYLNTLYTHDCVTMPSSTNICVLKNVPANPGPVLTFPVYHLRCTLVRVSYKTNRQSCP